MINPPDFKKPLMYEEISPPNDGDENYIDPKISEFLQIPYEEDIWDN